MALVSRPSARRRSLIGACLVIVALVAVPASALAQQDALVPESVAPPSQTEPPPGFGISARQAGASAERVVEVREARAEHPGMKPLVAIDASAGEPSFDVMFVTPGSQSQYGSDIRVDVIVSGLTGEVLHAWTGPQAATPLARGEEPSIGRALNRPYVWLPLAAIFFFAFFDPRRPLRLLHLDLLVLLGFGLSQLYFNQGRLEISMPLVYPLLGYLLVRMLLAGFRPRQVTERLVPRLPVRWMAIGLVLLVAFRVGLNLADSTVIDVGYASVVGADRVVHGEELYVDNDVHGDTYGPVNYLAYIPFEALLPWKGTWDSVPAAHAAAITFDLLTIVGLMLLGATLRPGRQGRQLGLALSFAWAAYPFSLLALQENTNDLMIAALLVLSLAALRSPPGRGALLGLAAAAKFAPLAIAPLLATGTGQDHAFLAAIRRRLRRRLRRGHGPVHPGRRATRALRHHHRLPAGTRIAVQPLGPSPEPRLDADAPQGGRRRAGGRRVLLPARAEPAPGGRARRRGHDRRAAARDALVLLLPRLDRAAGSRHIDVGLPRARPHRLRGAGRGQMD